MSNTAKSDLNLCQVILVKQPAIVFFPFQFGINNPVDNFLLAGIGMMGATTDFLLAHGL
jgi:hypothetical protein